MTITVKVNETEKIVTPASVRHVDPERIVLVGQAVKDVRTLAELGYVSGYGRGHILDVVAGRQEIVPAVTETVRTYDIVGLTKGQAVLLKQAMKAHPGASWDGPLSALWNGLTDVDVRTY